MMYKKKVWLLALANPSGIELKSVSDLHHSSGLDKFSGKHDLSDAFCQSTQEVRFPVVE